LGLADFPVDTYRDGLQQVRADDAQLRGGVVPTRTIAGSILLIASLASLSLRRSSDLLPLVAAVLTAIDAVQPGQVVRVQA
jgi:hypothetical protein